MKRLVALEWGEEEARLVVASLRKGTVVFEQAFAVPLAEDQASGTSASPAPLEARTIGQKIAHTAMQRGLGRCEVLVALGRSSIELRQLSLPPAPDEELPSLVRFQAVREFNALEEDWLLDFVPIDESADQPRRVLAAAIGPELLGQIQEVCGAAGWRPRRVVLRPCALASLVARLRPGSIYQARLLVHLLGQEADLTVMVDRKVVFLRTVRLPGDPLQDQEAASDLLLQIRRTMAAVANQLEGRRVASVVLCGVGPSYQALAQLADQQLGIPTELFHPFEGLELAEDLLRQLPDRPGLYAPLLGMLWDELEGVVPAIDFLHPRQPPQPPSPKRKLILLAALGVLAVLGFFGYQIYSKYSLASEVEQLRRQAQTLDQAIKQAERQQKIYTEIARWKETDVHWLEELRRLSERFPPASQAMVVQLLMGPGRGGGVIQLAGLAVSASDIDAVVERLRDPQHSVAVVNRAEDPSRPRYRWQFTIHLTTPHQ
ncbi:MAG: hypothetical protein NZ602_08480 [Thermoguttaceae bacterium]|nr:hypothetical protein [Thermoguttaceae bacterium]MDW8038974.1 hypothetical protein [Thermoguttaceae bacterium]